MITAIKAIKQDPKMTNKTYAVPAGEAEQELIIKKSRFIAQVAKASSREEAINFVAKVKERFPDARHHCWAYLIGHPEQANGGFSDDGEPNGTAGKPILNVLQHKDMGDIVAVVVRYFGGVKLGAGGLIRAYGGAAQAALEHLPIELIAPKKELLLTLNYEHEALARHYIERVGAEPKVVHYDEKVKIHTLVPYDAIDDFIEQIQDASKGSISVQIL